MDSTLVPAEWLAQFWSYVEKTDDCWLWRGASNNTGYGSFRLPHARSSIGAHRASWMIAHKMQPVPEGLCVLHSCDVRLCVNPAHLWLGTQKENMLDAKRKGRTRSGLKIDPTRAARGERHGLRKHPERAARGEEAGSSRLADADVRAIRREYVPRTVTQEALARKYGVSRRAVGMILSGQTWRHLL